MFKKLILYFLIAICIIACANRFYRVPVAQGNIVTDEMIDQLEIGLTSAQVQLIQIDGNILALLVLVKIKLQMFTMF